MVLGGERVEHKLEVGLCRRVLLIEVNLRREDLCRGDGHTALYQVSIAELC